MSLKPIRWLAALGLTGSHMVSAAPIRLHPENPRYFEWRGKTTVLVTSAEHYGAVINADFDHRRYLAALERDGMNYTRIFAGTYVEPPGAFNIERNTLAPADGRFLAPWSRSNEPGYAGGGNKFDLDRFDPGYLARLQDFIGEADKRGVVVELTLFCSIYGEAQWVRHPFHPANNTQALDVPDWKALHTDANGDALMERQEKLVRWLVRELNAHDNLFYEIQNEPWSDNHVKGEILNPLLASTNVYPNLVEIPAERSVAWQRRIASIIADEESRLPKRHLIAQNVANFSLAVREDDLAPQVSIVNFHYAHPEAAMWNQTLGRVIGYDETGFSGRADETYRRAAWRFMLAGGGLFNSLDYSFTVGREDGSDTDNNAPGGGSPALRKQLRALAGYLHGFPLERMHPDSTTVRRAPGVVPLLLSEPGRHYAGYFFGRGPTTLSLDLPRGSYRAEWIDPVTGAVSKSQSLRVARAAVALASPKFDDEIALRLVRE